MSFRTPANLPSGAPPYLDGESRFLRFVVRASLAALLAIVCAGVAVYVSERRSLRGQITRMELDVSRCLDAVVRSGDDLFDPMAALEETADGWLDRFRESKDVNRSDAERIFRLQDLRGRAIPFWREELSREDGSGRRKETVVLDVLREQTLWPDPPPPPIVWEISEGVKNFSGGVLEGVAWPLLAGSRAWSVRYAFHRRGFRLAAALRYIFFPRTAAGITFGGLLGFGVFVVLTGYLLCHAGMKINAPFLSVFGLLYFVYAAGYVLFVVSLLLRLVQ